MKDHTSLSLLIVWAVGLVAGFAAGFSTFYIPKTTIPTKQPVDHDRYYCHETGFLIKHFQMQENGAYIDALVTNRWNEPTKCELP